MSITLIYVILAIIQALFVLRIARQTFKNEAMLAFFMMSLLAPIVTAVLIFTGLDYCLNLIVGKDKE